MLDLITLTAVVCAIAAINWGLVAYNGTDLVATVVPNSQYQMYVKYAIGLCGLYFGLYAVTQLPKIPKVRAF